MSKALVLSDQPTMPNMISVTHKLFRHLRKPYLRFLLVVLTSLLSLSTAAATPIKVAFVADQGTNADSLAVLKLIKKEQAELLLIQGDLGYEDGAAPLWEENLNTALGNDFPVLTVVGNHENFEWPIYKKFIIDRVNRVNELQCEGDIGVKATCTYKGIAIVQVAPGVVEVEGVAGEDDYDDYIEEQLSASPSAWRICSWHKNQKLMQLGGKIDQTGWKVYQECLRQGAIVATGHEHSYSRTYLMKNFKKQVIAHKENDMLIEKGQTFAFVSGLGGHSIRPQLIDGDWWASRYTADQNASHGALFCTFDGDAAECYFKDITGAVPDKFTLKNNVLNSTAPSFLGAASSGLAALLALVLVLRCFLVGINRQYTKT